MSEFTAAAARMVALIRAAEGSTAPVSEGAIELAELSLREVEAYDRFTMFVGGARSVERMLAGTMLPCQDWGEELGRLTEGKLTAAMFRRPWNGDLPTIDTSLPDDPTPPSGAPAGALVEVQGRLGERPSGPLFTHVVDPTMPGSFVVTGLGMAWHLDEATAFALRTSIAAGLMDIATTRAASARAA